MSDLNAHYSLALMGTPEGNDIEITSSAWSEAPYMVKLGSTSGGGAFLHLSEEFAAQFHFELGKALQIARIKRESITAHHAEEAAAGII